MFFAGQTQTNIEETLRKLKTYFGIEKLLLEGGCILNSAFQRAGVIDKSNLVAAPIAAEAEDKPLFMDADLECYTLADAQNHDGIVWMNYWRNKK